MAGKHSLKLLAAMLAAAPLLVLSACGGSGSGSPTNFNSQLHGTCIWQTLAMPIATQASAGPATILAPLSFDGAGHVSFDYYVNIDGSFSTTPNVSGTYQMGSGGHGSMTFTSPASSTTLTYDLFLTPGGGAVRTITRAYLNQPASTRVSSGVCRFDE